MPKLKKSKIKITVTPPTLAKLRKLFRASPELAPFASYIGGGIKAVEYAFNVLDAAATVEAPRGIALASVSIRPKSLASKKAKGEVACADWIIEAIKKQIGYKEETCCHGRTADQYCVECDDGRPRTNAAKKKRIV